MMYIHDSNFDLTTYEFSQPNKSGLCGTAKLSRLLDQPSWGRFEYRKINSKPIMPPNIT